MIVGVHTSPEQMEPGRIFSKGDVAVWPGSYIESRRLLIGHGEYVLRKEIGWSRTGFS